MLAIAFALGAFLITVGALTIEAAARREDLR